MGESKTAEKAEKTEEPGATRTSTAPGASEGVHPTWEEAEKRIADETAAYRAEKEKVAAEGSTSQRSDKP